MADITLGQFYNAIAQGAREATLNALKDKDFATQTTLAEILSKLSDPATQATLLDVLNKLDDLTAVKNLLTEGDAKVQLKGQTEVIKLVDALAITDPVYFTTDYIENLGEYRAWDIYLSSTLDVSVRVRLVWGSDLPVDGVLMADGSIRHPRLSGTWQGYYLQKTNGPIRLAYVPWTDDRELADREYYQKRLSPRVAVECRTTIAATEGALSIWFVGRR